MDFDNDPIILPTLTPPPFLFPFSFPPGDDIDAGRAATFPKYGVPPFFKIGLFETEFRWEGTCRALGSGGGVYELSVRFSTDRAPEGIRWGMGPMMTGMFGSCEGGEGRWLGFGEELYA